MTENEQTKPERRTKRRYAHELYPHAEEGQIRPLAEEVPYLYARAQGFEVEGTGWFDYKTPAASARSVARTSELILSRHVAFLADALAQGMAGDEAWAWAVGHAAEESGELVWERAEVYGVDPELIKPYPCGPEPESHYHFDPARPGTRYVVRAGMPESKCEQCTEPIEAS
ncbi:hypothetical protein [Rathayibacter sp. Leaf248]|uniref:hypothetical protein n=1 Tax=Rathayibacter sp. Leaf248 TaxID=2876555 RepID=UPI001E457BBD|nr:hypothetical protein [Rathayibacter sp. Leaf248]